jgi:periplasmic divalent cation tolerance protein
MTDALQVVTTAGSQDEAEHIARQLVERKLAACVQVIGPMTSIYHWQGEVERAAEWLLQIKTDRARYGEVEAAIRALHSYEVPEILALAVAAGSADYLRWLAS